MILKTFQIFRAGTHRASNGQATTVSLDDLNRMAENYNRSGANAPLVVGHPSESEQPKVPHYGKIRRLFVDGIKLIAQADVTPSFVEAVRAGRFKHVSASLFPPAHPSNPTAGGWSLRHVGFVAIPAVKGMDALSFCESLDFCEYRELPDPADVAKPYDFNEAMREYADPESVKLHDAAIEYQQHFKTSYEEAVFACIRIKRMAEAAPSPEAALADILNAFPI